jgi:hypothetical protein
MGIDDHKGPDGKRGGQITDRCAILVPMAGWVELGAVLVGGQFVSRGNESMFGI